MRLSFERVHDDQTEKDRSPNRAGEAATSAGRTEGRASAIGDTLIVWKLDRLGAIDEAVYRDR